MADDVKQQQGELTSGYLEMLLNAVEQTNDSSKLNEILESIKNVGVKTQERLEVVKEEEENEKLKVEVQGLETQIEDLTKQVKEEEFGKGILTQSMENAELDEQKLTSDYEAQLKALKEQYDAKREALKTAQGNRINQIDHKTKTIEELKQKLQQLTAMVSQLKPKIKQTTKDNEVSNDSKPNTVPEQSPEVTSNEAPEQKEEKVSFFNKAKGWVKGLFVQQESTDEKTITDETLEQQDGSQTSTDAPKDVAAKENNEQPVEKPVEKKEEKGYDLLSGNFERIFRDENRNPETGELVKIEESEKGTSGLFGKVKNLWTKFFYKDETVKTEVQQVPNEDKSGKNKIQRPENLKATINGDKYKFESKLQELTVKNDLKLAFKMEQEGQDKIKQAEELRSKAFNGGSGRYNPDKAKDNMKNITEQEKQEVRG